MARGAQQQGFRLFRLTGPAIDEGELVHRGGQLRVLEALEGLPKGQRSQERCLGLPVALLLSKGDSKQVQNLGNLQALTSSVFLRQG